MNHEHEVQVILYAAGQLSSVERAHFEEHLVACLDCQADLQLWQMTVDEIRASNAAVPSPVHLVERALNQIHHPTSLQAGLRQAWQLLYVQSQIIQREMWPASAAVMTLGAIVALISDHVEFVYFVAPLVAAASLAILCSSDYDPALELTLSTPTSPWKVLLARLSIVSGYNLLLALGAALILLVIIPPELLGTLILGWLGPMTFLSALALLLSAWIGTGNAIAIAYGLWMVQYIPYRSVGAWMVSPGWASVIFTYQQFWQNPALLLSLSVLLFGIALWFANRPTFRLAQETI
jgi:hypothetical protein